MYYFGIKEAVMRFTRWAVILAIPAMLFALAGCGSDSSGAFNPTTLGTGGGTGGGGGGGTGTTEKLPIS